MTGEWVAASILTAVVALVVGLFQRVTIKQVDRLGVELKAQGKEHGNTLTEIKLGLRDCVKWSDLDKELAPVRCCLKDHDHRLTVMETECKGRHKD